MDLSTSNISEYFQLANEFIGMNQMSGFFLLMILAEEAKGDENNKVLVHCQAGVSRSPTLVIAFLMHNQRWSLK